MACPLKAPSGPSLEAKVSAESHVPMTNQELWLAIGLMTSYVLCWFILWFFLRKRKKLLGLLFEKGNLLRMVTVIFIVLAVLYLTILGKMPSEASAAILAGIAGHVLGSTRRTAARE